MTIKWANEMGLQQVQICRRRVTVDAESKNFASMKVVWQHERHKVFLRIFECEHSVT